MIAPLMALALATAPLSAPTGAHAAPPLSPDQALEVLSGAQEILQKYDAPESVIELAKYFQQKAAEFGTSAGRVIHALSKYQLWGYGLFLMLPDGSHQPNHAQSEHHDLLAGLYNNAGLGVHTNPFPLRDTDYGTLECDDGTVSNVPDCPEGWMSMTAVGAFVDLGDLVLIFDGKNLSGIETDGMTDDDLDALEDAVTRGYVIID